MYQFHGIFFRGDIFHFSESTSLSNFYGKYSHTKFFREIDFCFVLRVFLLAWPFLKICLTRFVVICFHEIFEYLFLI